MNGRHAQITPPESFPDIYTESDKGAIARIHAWLAEPGRRTAGYTQSSLAKRAGVNVGTFNQVLQGKYPSSPTEHLRRVVDVIELERSRSEHRAVAMPHVDTSVYRAVVAAAKRARMYRNFAVISAYVGTGKTHAVKRYCEDSPHALLMEARPGLAAYVMLDVLVRLTAANVTRSRGATNGTKDAMFDALVTKLRGSDTLLIVDEAETLTEQSLEYIRRLRDLAEIGVVLIGTERLFPLVRDPRGRFGQISSRVGFWPPVITAITQDDAKALACAAFAADGIDEQLTDEVYDALWQVCDGSARVLCEAVIPGLRDYALHRGTALTPAVIFKVSTDVLGFKRPTRRA